MPCCPRGGGPGTIPATSTRSQSVSVCDDVVHSDDTVVALCSTEAVPVREQRLPKMKRHVSSRGVDLIAGLYSVAAVTGLLLTPDSMPLASAPFLWAVFPRRRPHVSGFRSRTGRSVESLEGHSQAPTPFGLVRAALLCPQAG